MIYYKKNSFIKKIFLKISRSEFSFAPVFSFLKPLLFCFLGLIAFVYFSYLLLLPKFVNEERVESVLNNYLSKNTKLVLDIENLKIYPNYKFDINLKADSIKLKYSKSKDFLTIQKPSIDINFLTLFFGYIDFNRVKADKIVINTNFTKNRRYSCFDYFDLDIFNFDTADLAFKPRNFKILCDDFILNLYDENIKKSFYINSKKLKFILLEQNKPFVISTKGTLRSANHKIADFNLDFECVLKKDALNLFKDFVSKLNYNPLLYADKYKFYSNAVIKLKSLDNNLSGSVKLSDYSFVVDKITVPKNNILILFKGDKIVSDCNFNFTKDQFVKVHFLKSKFLELKLTSNEINLAEIKQITDAFFKIFYPKLNTKDILFSGILKADLYLKSDFKTINSKGFLKIKDAKITHKPLNLSLDNINSDINFENNKINILNSTALIDKAKFHLFGLIDDKMNLDLKIKSETINITRIMGLLKTLPFSSLLDDYVFKDGLLKIDAAIGGSIQRPVVETNSYLKNLKIFIKPYNILLSSLNVFIDKDLSLSADNTKLESEYGTLEVPKAKAKLLNNELAFWASIVPYSNLFSVKNKNLTLEGRAAIEKNTLEAELYSLNKKLASIFATKKGGKILLEDRISLILPLYDNLSFDAVGNINFDNSSADAAFNLYNVNYTPLGLFVDNIPIEAKLSNNTLSIEKFSANLFNGSIEGRVNINLKNLKTKAEILLKGINVRHFSSHFKQFSIAASGKLSAIINAQITGSDIKTLDSYIKFNINDGQLAQFAKLERLLQAGNILSQSVLKLTLNSAISAITKQNTGDFKTIEGTVKIKNSIADIQYIKTQGTNMSLYITGSLNLLNNIANLKILGRIPVSMVSVLGGIGRFSTGQLVDKMSQDTKDIINSITVSPFEKMMSCPIAQEDILNIPPLANQISGTQTREFIVRVLGPVENTSSVKYFKWRARENE